MPVSQYDQPGQYQFLNTYVPIPFEQMAGALQQRQRSYEQAAAARDATFNALKDIPAHRLDEPAYQEIMSGLDKELYDFQKENPDLSTLEARTGLNRILQSTTRKRFFRDIQANLPVLQQMEKDLATAEAEGREWDAMDIQEALEQYQSAGGAVGAGQIAPRGLAKATDIVPTLETMGRSFVKEGVEYTYDDPSGQYRITGGGKPGEPAYVGVSPDEVASVFGLSVRNGVLELDYIPEKIYSNPEFATIRNRARYAAKYNPDLSYEEAVSQAYYQAVAPLVDKFSGYQLSGGQTFTTHGFHKLQQPDVMMEFMDSAVAKLNQREKISKGFGQRFKNFVIGGLGSFAPALGVEEKEAYQLAPDEKSIISKVISGKSAEYSSGDFDKLTDKEKLKAIKATNKYIEDWNKKAISFPVASVDRNTKRDLDVMILGQDAADGVLTGDQISGAVMNLKIFSGKDPSSEKTINEVIKKGQSIESIGPVDYTNDYAPGLYKLNIGDENYYYVIPQLKHTDGSEIAPDEPLYGYDAMSQQMAWWLEDYRRDPSGSGRWFSIDNGQTWLRSAVTQWSGENPELIKVEYVDNATYQDAIAKGLVKESDEGGASGHGEIPGIPASQVAYGENALDVFRGLQIFTQ
jgi:hypothetical protein